MSKRTAVDSNPIESAFWAGEGFGRLLKILKIPIYYVFVFRIEHN